MKFIHSAASIIEEVNPCKKVEMIGRICYKSEKSITDISCYDFIKRLCQNQHYAMLEHGVLTYEIPFKYHTNEDLLTLLNFEYVRHTTKYNKYLYVTISLSHIYKWLVLKEMQHNPWVIKFYSLFADKYINKSTDLFSMYSSCYDLNVEDIKLLNSIQDIENLSTEDEKIHRTLSIRFICDRGVSHELVRHRCSVAMESTRYCNYSLDKFGKELTFIYPSNLDQWSQDQKELLFKSCKSAEYCYMKGVESGLKPQQARAFLNNAIKTELVLTMPLGQWYHLFDLRLHGTTGAPHPDMKELASKAAELFNSVCTQQ